MQNNKCLLYRLLRFIGKPIFFLLFRPKIVNKIKELKNEPIIFCGNHTSYFDPLLLVVSTKRIVHFMTKKELFKGIGNYFFTSVGCIPVDRKNKDKFAVNSAIEVLNANQVIGIFPEGTINKTNDIIMPFKYGAVSIAKKTNAWIVPFSITGKYKVLKSSVKIVFGKPFKVTGDLEKENKKLMNKVKKLIKVNNEK